MWHMCYKEEHTHLQGLVYIFSKFYVMTSSRGENQAIKFSDISGMYFWTAKYMSRAVNLHSDNMAHY